MSRITVNLAPATHQRKGAQNGAICPFWRVFWPPGGSSGLDGPDPAPTWGSCLYSGSLRPVGGDAAHGLNAPRAGIEQLYVPAPSAAEATLAGGLEVYPVESGAAGGPSEGRPLWSRAAA